MSTSVPPQYQQFVKQEVAAGHYRFEDEVVAAAFELLQRRKQDPDVLRAELLPSIDELNKGGGILVERDDLRKFLGEIVA